MKPVVVSVILLLPFSVSLLGRRVAPLVSSAALAPGPSKGSTVRMLVALLLSSVHKLLSLWALVFPQGSVCFPLVARGLSLPVAQ